ncbi:MAG TPA: SgcJ/EcaC family oxidoreductase [Terriglobales bacterium]|nr:SgcJ/EcaC family oxidoreductase [Terriglobales bacterium]
MSQTLRVVVVLIPLLHVSAVAQNGVDPGARKAIDAGNQAWVDGTKNGNAAAIADTYAEDAVDCSPDGTCIRGRAAIEDYFKQRLATAARARSAAVRSIGAVQQGGFVYEWGHAEAILPDGKKIGGRYLTAWRRQADGTWKIFRNMPIPNDKNSQ